MDHFFYKPMDAWCADFIPFFREKNGRFELFYIQDDRQFGILGQALPWARISTTDFVHFEEHGIALRQGTQADQALSVFTGSVIFADGMYHIFYTGHNPYFMRDLGKPQEAVMHAVSRDFIHWERLPADTFYADTARYQKDDWRDPFVFYNPDEHCYWMLLSARKQGMPENVAGCTGLCTSQDLHRWQPQDPIYEPSLFCNHECPDLFRIGEWWYLIFFASSCDAMTYYRMARSPHGPWITPRVDTLDGRAFNAGKTASDGKHRYAFGWNPTRVGDNDHGGWEWGGQLVVHEVVQLPGGQLGVKIPDTIRDAFSEPYPVSLSPAHGTWETIPLTSLGTNADATMSVALADVLPHRCLLEITMLARAKRFGLLLRVQHNGQGGYCLELNLDAKTISFMQADGTVMIQRTIQLQQGQPIHLTILVEDTILVVYLDDCVALSARMYDYAQGLWGIWACEGMAVFNDLTIKLLPCDAGK